MHITEFDLHDWINGKDALYSFNIMQKWIVKWKNELIKLTESGFFVIVYILETRVLWKNRMSKNTVFATGKFRKRNAYVCPPVSSTLRTAFSLDRWRCSSAWRVRLSWTAHRDRHRWHFLQDNNTTGKTDDLCHIRVDARIACAFLDVERNRDPRGSWMARVLLPFRSRSCRLSFRNRQEWESPSAATSPFRRHGNRPLCLLSGSRHSATPGPTEPYFQ